MPKSGPVSFSPERRALLAGAAAVSSQFFLGKSSFSAPSGSTLTDVEEPLDSVLRKIPKAELHVHFSGTLHKKTLERLASKYRVDESESIEKAFDRSGFNNVLTALKLASRLMAQPEDLRDAVYATQQEAADNGVRYREMFWNPSDQEEVGGIPYAAAQEGLVAGLADAERDFGIVGRLIPSIDRSGTPERALRMVEDVLANPSSYTLGIGMDYLEADGAPEHFWKAYRMAYSNGLRCTAHAGEDGAHPRNIDTCLSLLRCSRIDHGYTVLEDETLTQRCLEEGIVFNVAPSNSYYSEVLAGQDWSVVHPIRHMIDRGLKLSLGTDDPPLHFTDPGQAYISIVRDFGATLDDVRGIIGNSIDGCWAPEPDKAAWRAAWLQEFDEMRSTLPS